MPPDLTASDFSTYIDRAFPVTAGEVQLMLVLTEATARAPVATHLRTPFSLMFRGPAQPILPQGTYDFEHPQHGTLAIFIVPVGADATGVQYQAVFS